MVESKALFLPGQVAFTLINEYPTVGAGLPAKAVALGWWPGFRNYRLVGAGLPAMAVYLEIATFSLGNRRVEVSKQEVSKQEVSKIVVVAGAGFVARFSWQVHWQRGFPHVKGGSWLACDSDLRRSPKLKAATSKTWTTITDSIDTTTVCGSWLACDSGGCRLQLW
ncbi:hypothetical protein [Pseudomonas tolaasii]|uniref:hypothetical protein n=1 Tax=Pseudomonas tolaasii TaxID=29442 RepID=UPI0012DB5E9F|nr:hypothetical protein [Pseudomonas tolaasii]